MGSTLRLTISGDVETAEIRVDSSIAIRDLVREWAARCSSHAPDELVVLSGDSTTVFDQGDNLAALGLRGGTVLRLVTGDEALGLEAGTVTTTLDSVAVFPSEQAAFRSDAAGWDEPPAVGAGARPGGEAERTTYRGSILPVSQSLEEDEDGWLPPKVSWGSRLARALKAVLARGPAATAGPALYGKATTSTPGARYRRAMQENDRVHSLEMLTRGARLSRCVVVAVVSPKGGAGKTTVTALLGTMLAELRRDPVLALDANPDFGNLRDKLASAGHPARTTDELAEWLAARPSATPAELSAQLGLGPHGLRYVPTPVGDLDRMVLTADYGLYRDLIARLRDYEGIILIDCGTGLLDPPVRAALEAADQILLVTDNSPDTAGLVVTAAQFLPPQTPTWLIANKIPEKGSMVDLSRVVSDIPQLRGVTVLPEQRLAENIVTPDFTWDEGPGAWQEPLREVAARLAGNWATLA